MSVSPVRLTGGTSLTWTLTIDLVNVDQVNADVMLTSAVVDPVLTSAGHVALSSAASCHAVCSSFSENLYLIPEIVLSFKNS